MYCTNCGEIIKDGINFCPNCGKKIDTDGLMPKEVDKCKSSSISTEKESVHKEVDKDKGKSIERLNKKIPILAAFLSFIIPGAGQIYNQEIRKGVIYLITSIVVPIMALYLLYENNNMDIAIFANFVIIAYIIFYIYTIIDAYRIAKI